MGGGYGIVKDIQGNQEVTEEPMGDRRMESVAADMVPTTMDAEEVFQPYIKRVASLFLM